MNSVWARETGYEKREKVYSTNNVESTFFFDDVHQSYFFCFCPIKYPIERSKSMQNMCFDSRFLKTHHSTISTLPLFQL